MTHSFKELIRNLKSCLFIITGQMLNSFRLPWACTDFFSHQKKKIEVDIYGSIFSVTVST